MNKKNTLAADGNTIRQEGYCVKKTIVIGAATYVVSRQFSAGERKKQDLLLSLISQKLADGKLVDCNKENEI